MPRADRLRHRVSADAVVDWAPAIILILVDLVDHSARSIPANHAGQLIGSIPLTLLTMGAIGFRRRWPLLVLVIVLAGMAVESAVLPDDQSKSFQASVALCLAAFGAGMYTTGQRQLVVAMLLPGALLAAFAIFQGEAFAIDAIPNWFWPAGCAAVGHTLSDRRRLVRMLEDRADRLEREREEKARAAVVEERARIAREMHDVVAHNVSVMVVQAGAARRVMRSDIVPATEALITIENTGRETQ